MEFSSLFAMFFLRKLFISFHNKIWRYDDVTTALWKNQRIVIVYSIFWNCPNKVSCLVNGRYYPQQRLICFEKKKNKKQILLVSCPPIVVVEQKYHISQKNDLSQKSLFVLLNHFWYKPIAIKWFFFMNSLSKVKERAVLRTNFLSQINI